jgi:hypothetical protein
MGPPMRTGVWTTSPFCALGDGATHRRPRSRPRSWPVCHNEFSSDHWPASNVVVVVNVVQQICSVIDCASILPGEGGMSQREDLKAVGVLFLTLGQLVLKVLVH